jgi:hypothetical protein
LGWIDGGDNQFLSANTWHNLVYATQGGGGVRTCYLDGRKLGDVPSARHVRGVPAVRRCPRIRSMGTR